MFTQSCGRIKSGSFNEDFTDAPFGRARLFPAADFVTARLAAATPVPLSQTAPGSAAAFPARMNGLGAAPFAIRNSCHRTTGRNGSVFDEHGGPVGIARMFVPSLDKQPVDTFALGSHRLHLYQHPIPADVPPPA